jgi:hypothetical protein
MTGDIYKGTFNITTGTWSQQKKLNDYFVIKGVKNNNGLSIDSTTELLDFGHNTNNFWIDGSNRLNFRFKTDGGLVETSSGSGIKLSDNSLSLSTSGLSFNIGNGLMTSINGVAIKLADTSLDVSTLGLQVSPTYKTELQQIKTQAETAKTQAETAKTAAEAARTQAETAKTQATTQATTATSQATIATTQATTATTQAGIATTQATAATAAAASATASAGSATASAGAAAASAVFCASINLIPGPQGPTGPQGPQGPQGPSGNPLSITWSSPLNYSTTNSTASIDLSNYVYNISFDEEYIDNLISNILEKTHSKDNIINLLGLINVILLITYK